MHLIKPQSLINAFVLVFFSDLATVNFCIIIVAFDTQKLSLVLLNFPNIIKAGIFRSDKESVGKSRVNLQNKNNVKE